MRLAGKAAIITGGAVGQGAAEARLFAREGASVLITDVTDREGEQVAEEIRRAGGKAQYRHLNVCNPAEWQAAIRFAVEQFGTVNVLVNNAGTLGDSIQGGYANVADTSIEGWDAVMAVNAKGPFLGTKFVIPEMKKSGGGSIINISSVGGLEGRLAASAYVMSKGAIRLLTKATAVQFGCDNIRCNSILPGLVETAMTSRGRISDPAKRRRNELRLALRRVGQPEEIAYCALFLASDESSFVTGSDLVADGGLTAGAASVAIELEHMQ
jgi:cyclopentanol dehydrogenase